MLMTKIHTKKRQ